MRKILVLALLMAGSTALAQPVSTAMSCAEASNLVTSEGAIVIYTGEYTYDRFVAHGGYCEVAERTQPAWIPTADVEQCFVGYTCRGLDHD